MSRPSMKCGSSPFCWPSATCATHNMYVTYTVPHLTASDLLHHLIYAPPVAPDGAKAALSSLSQAGLHVCHTSTACNRATFTKRLLAKVDIKHYLRQRCTGTTHAAGVEPGWPTPLTHTCRRSTIASASCAFACAFRCSSLRRRPSSASAVLSARTLLSTASSAYV